MSETGPMTLTEFLLARIAEDAGVARRLHADNCGPMSPTCGCDWRIDRMLARCKADQLIVEAASDRLGGPNWRDAIDYVMREMATIYADHPDYREEWRP